VLRQRVGALEAALREPGQRSLETGQRRRRREGRVEAQRAHALTEHCREQLLAAGYEVVTEPGQSTLVSFRVPGDTTEAVERLYEAGVVLRELPGTGLLRASVGWWNDESDVERLVSAL